MRNGVQVNLSAKITGYQNSLQQLRQALDRLNPGASIKKSLEDAFKVAEDYVNRLTKKPLVNITSESQLKNLEANLETAFELISKVSSGFSGINLNDLSPKFLNEGLQQTIKLLDTAKAQLNEVSNGPKLSTLGQEVVALKDLFISMGNQFDSTTLGQGVELLTKKLQESQTAAKNAKQAYENAKKTVADYIPVMSVDITSSKAFHDRESKLARNLKHDYTNATPSTKFSSDTLDAYKKSLESQLQTSMGKLNLGSLTDAMKAAFDKAFAEGLDTSIFKGRMDQFQKEIESAFSGTGLKFPAIRDMIFGGDTSGKGTTALADMGLEKVSTQLNDINIKGSTAYNTLTECMQILEKWGNLTAQQKTQISNFLDVGQFQAARDAMQGILTAARQANRTKNSERNQLKQNAQQARVAWEEAEKQVTKTNDALTTLKGTPQFQTMQSQIARLNEEVKNLQTELEKLRNQKVDDTKGLAGGIKTTAENFKLSAKEAQQYEAELQKIQARQKFIGKIQGVVQRWFSIYAVVRMVSNAIKSMISTIKELDKTITNIAIVTNMSQSDLWGQMPQYTQMAREYAASISGVYEVSQLYYQQGLQTVDVMKLTEETLKMARISGLDYAESTNYMTNAIRSFKMEMEDAGRITDTYSAIAASSATSVAELAQAMSKTASSAQAVGSSFENTTAMMAVMIEATRQAPENIGSAMKSIISRYGELKENPAKLVDSQGQELSLNKVDKALQSVGISIHDAQGQFREFDDVIMELAESWDTIDTNTQRYIATVMAGNRQQSRFLALVSSYDRLKELSAIAADSENTSQLQYLKTLDSVEAKTQQLQTSMQSLYTDSGIEQTYKGWLDFANSYVKMLNSMGTGTSGLLKAISQIGITFYNAANVVTTAFRMARTKLQAEAKAREMIVAEEANLRQLQARSTLTGIENAERTNTENAITQSKRRLKQYEEEYRRRGQLAKATNERLYGTGFSGFVGRHKAGIGMGLSLASMATSAIAANQQNQQTQGWLGTTSTALSGASMGLMMSGGNPWGLAAGAFGGLILGIIQNASKIWQSEADKLKELQEKASEANNKALEKQADTKALNTQIQQLRKLEAARYDSVEAEEAYYEAANQMAEKYPALIKSLDSVGNATIDLKTAELELKEIREASAKAIKDAAIAEYKTQIQREKMAQTPATGNYQGLGQYIEDRQIARSDFINFGQTYSADYITKGAVAPQNSVLLQIYEQLLYGTTINGVQYDRDAIDLSTLLANSQWSSQLSAINRDSLNNDLDKAIYDYFIQFLPDNKQSSQIQSAYLKQLAHSQQTRKAGIVRTISSINAGKEEDYSYLTEMSIAGDLLGEIGETSYWKYAKKKEETDLSDVDLYSDYLNIELEEYIETANDSLQTFWTETLSTDELRSQFNELTRNRKTITRKEMQIALGKFTTDSELITNLLNAMYGFQEPGVWDNPERVSAERERLSRQAEARSKRTQRKIKDNEGQEKDNPLNLALIQQEDIFWKGITDYEHAQLLAFYDPLQKQVDNGQIDPTRAQTILNRYLELADQIQNAENEQAEELFWGWTDWTRTGIQQLAEKLKEHDVNVNVTGFANSVVYNIDAILLQIENTIAGAVKQYEEAISQATSGMSTDKALEFAAKNGFDLSQLELRNGKWYADSAQLLGKIHQNFEKTYKEEKKSYDEVLKEGQGFQLLQFKGPSYLRQKLQEGISIEELAKNSPALRNQSSQFLDIYEKFLKDENAVDQTFEQWLQAKTKNIEAMQDAERYAYGDALLQTGHVNEFVQLVNQFDGVDDKTWDQIVADYKNNSLPDAMKIYEGSIKKYLEQSLTPIYDAASRLLSGQSREEGILVTSKNKNLLNKIGEKEGKTWEEGQTAYLTIDNIRDGWQDIVNTLGEDAALSLRQKREYAAKLWNSQFENNAFDTFDTAISSWDKMDFSTWLALPKAMQNIVDFTSSTGKGILDLNQAAELLTSDYLIKEQHLTEKQANEVRASLLKAQREQSAAKILPDIIKNREKLSEDNIASLANLLEISYDQALKEIHAFKNDDGTYRVDVSRIRKLMQLRNYELTNEMEQMIAESLQDSITDVQDAIRGVSTGYTNLSDMQKLMNQFEQAGMGLSFDELFRFNKSLGAYTLSAQGLFRQFVLARQQLEGGTKEQQKAAKQLLAASDRELKQNINISNLISANTIDTETSNTFINSINAYNAYAKAMGQLQYDAEELQTALIAGGQEGLDAAKAIADITGKSLSAEDAATLYRKPAEQWLKAMENLTATPGAIIDETSNDLLIAGQGATRQLANGSYQVIRSAEDLSNAYRQLYTRLYQSGAATISELNSIVGKIFESQEKSDLVSSINNLAELTYSDLGKIYEVAGKELTEEQVNQMLNSGAIRSLGGGKIRVSSFERFAQEMGIDSNTEAYTSAFRTYNDAMIKVNDQARDNITKSAQSVLNAQVGTQINLTDIYTRLNDAERENLLQDLEDQGATLKEGILTINNNASANLEEIYQIIYKFGYQIGQLTDADVAEMNAEMNKILFKRRRETNISAVVSNIVSNSDKLTEDNVEQLAQVLKIPFQEALKYFREGEQGYFKISQNSLKEALGDKWQELDKSTQLAIERMTVDKIDQATNLLTSDLSSSITTGYSDLAAVRNLIDQLNKTGYNRDTERDFQINDLVEFDAKLGKWMLTETGILAQIQYASEQLKDNSTELTKYKQSLMQQVEDAIDISSYLQSDRFSQDENRQTLKRALKDYNTVAQALGEKVGINIDKFIKALDAGGSEAVNALQEFSQITGQKFSDADYTLVFMRQADKMATTIEQLETSIGGIVDQHTVQLAGIQDNVVQIGNSGKYLITSTIDLVSAYNSLYKQLQNTVGTTLQQINNVYAKYLKASKRDSNILSKISSNKLDIDTLEEIANELGVKLQDIIAEKYNYGIKQLDNGDYQITSFSDFTARLGITDKTSSAYKAASKAWADAQITSFTEQSTAINEELNNLINANTGDYINLSTLWNRFPDLQKEKAALFKNWGLTFQEGILYINDEAKKRLPDIVNLFKGSLTSYQTNQIYASLQKTQRENSITNLYLDLMKTRESLTEDNLLALANGLKLNYQELTTALSSRKQIDGTYKLSAADIDQLFSSREKDIDDAVKNVVSISIAETVDGYVQALNGLGTKVFNLSDMKKMVKDLSERAKNVNQENLFQFNQALGGYVLTTQGIYAQFKVAASEAQTANEDVTKLLESSAQSLLGDINISQLMSDINSNLGVAVEAKKKFINSIDNYNAAMAALGKEGLNANLLLQELAKGGSAAVSAAKTLASKQGIKLSDSELTAIYRNEVDKLLAASEELINVSIGGVVSSTTADILHIATTDAKRLTYNGAAVIQSAADLVDAYTNIYNQLIKSGAATLSELNKIAAQKLQAVYAQKHGNQNSIKYVQQAANMSYEDFGEMLAQAGYELTDDTFKAFDDIITELGNGQIRINDFDALAKKIGWDTTSDSYINGLKAYNDALLEADKQVQKAVADEISAIKDATSGDRLNLTTFSKKLSNRQRRFLNLHLQQYGAYLEETGILNLNERANLPRIISILSTKAEQAGLLLEQDVQNLADVVSEILTDFVDILNKGIKGTLTQSESIKLAEQAKNWFNINLTFTQTYEGLKLSTDQATELYYQIKGIDNIGAHTVFKELQSSLTKSGEVAHTASGLMAEIAHISEQINKNEAAGTEAAERTNKVLQRRLSLYNEIAISQIDSPDAYDWMNNPLPAGMQGVKNYWDSWGKAFKTLNQIANGQNKELKQGETRQLPTIEIQDFYNMVNEMNNLAALGDDIYFLGYKLDGSLESASKLIDAGLAAITNVDGEGAKINLTKFGIDFTEGAEGMGTNIHEAIQKMADSQIEMLDGLIQLLETVVAMEKLSSIDTKGDGLELTELFDSVGDNFYVANQATVKAINEIKEEAKTNKDLAAALQTVKVNGNSMLEIFQKLNGKTKLTEQEATEYTESLNALYQMMQSGEYSTEQVATKLLEISKGTGATFEIDVGKGNSIIISQGYRFKRIDGNYIGPNGKNYGTNWEAALKQYQDEENNKLAQAAFTKTVDSGVIQLENKQQIIITDNFTLFRDNDRIKINGVDFSDPKAAAKYIQDYGINSDSASITQALDDGFTYYGQKTQGDVTIKYATLNGFTYKVTTEGNKQKWEDSQGNIYTNGVEAYKGDILSQEIFQNTNAQDFAVTVDSDNTVTATVYYGAAIKMALDEKGNLQYTIGNTTYRGITYNQALQEAATRVLNTAEISSQKHGKSVSEQTQRQILEWAQPIGLVTKFETADQEGNQYQLGNKKYSTWKQVQEALVALLYDSKTGNLVDTSTLQSRLNLNPSFEVISTKVTITNPQSFASMTRDQLQEAMDALMSGDKGRIQTTFGNVGIAVDWDDANSELTVSEIQSLAQQLGTSFEAKTLMLSASFSGEGGQQLAKLLSENGINVKVNLTPGTDTSGLGVGDSTTPAGQDEATTVYLNKLKVMVSQENVDWTAVSSFLATVPEDKRPSVESAAKEYIINYIKDRLTKKEITFNDLPTQLTNLDGLTAPELIALATILQVGLDKDAKPTPSADLTQDKLQALANTLGVDVNTLQIIIEALRLSARISETEVEDDGSSSKADIESDMSEELKAWLASMFPDGKYTPSDIQAITLIALVAGLLLKHEGEFGAGEINDSGVTLPSNPQSSKSITSLTTIVSALKLLYENGAAGLDYEELNTTIDTMVKEGTITPTEAKDLKVLVKRLFLSPEKEANLEPNVGDVVTLDENGNINGGQLDMSIEVKPVFTISDEEKRFRELRQQVLKESNNPWIAHDTSVAFSASFSDYDYLQKLRTRVFDQGQVLGPSDFAILDKWQKQLESLSRSTAYSGSTAANGWKRQLEALKAQSEQNTWDMTNNIELMSQAFKDIDLSQINALNEALSGIIENATTLQSIEWDVLVSSINELNKIQIPEQQVLNVDAIMRTIQASVTLDYGGDAIATEVITQDIIVRTLKLNLDDSEIKSLFERLKDLFEIDVGVNTEPEAPPTNNLDSTTYDGGLGDAADDLNKAGKAAQELGNDVTELTSAAEAYPADAAGRVSDFGDATQTSGQTADRAATTVSGGAARASTAAYRVASALNSIQSKEIDIKLNIEAKSGDSKVSGTIDGKPINPRGATSVSIAEARGTALAAGQTLMGELGPELVVSNGRYFLVGENGAEMVNLASDAIVFNHLQTEQLLKNKRTSRGTPATNERNAVSYAKGSGPALVGASEALAALKRIRAMWQSLRDASLKDIGSMAGLESVDKSSGGGGGGSQDPEQIKAIIEEIERWYNLLRQIDSLEKEITYQESLQAKIESDRVANGQALYRSYKEEIKALDDEIIRNQQLAELQQSWYERKRDEFTHSDYGKIFTYNDKGLLQLRDGRDLGLDVLEQLTARGIYGQTSDKSLNAKAQIDYLRSIGFKTENLKYNDDGTVIDASSEDYKDNPDQIYEDMMQNFWDNLDGWKDELDSVYDSYHDQLNNVLSNENKRNQLLQKIIDNQLSVQQDVLKAIESREQKLIDELQDQRDAFEKSNKDFLDGLNDQLNQQKQMYQNQESQKELVKLRRQLAILQRSGGSGSQIRSLQDQIAAKEQNQYFTLQQQQIANIQKAADLQIKRMDSQIELMTQTLEYQKQHGLLWQEVYEVMAATPEQIRQFIMENTPDFQSASALDVAEKIRDIDLRINEWVSYRDDESAPIMDNNYYDWDSYQKARSGRFGKNWTEDLASEVKTVFDEWLAKTGDINLAGQEADKLLKEKWGEIHPEQGPVDFDEEEKSTEEHKQIQSYKVTSSSPYKQWLQSKNTKQKDKKATEQAAQVTGRILATEVKKILQTTPPIRIDLQETTPVLSGGFAKYSTGTGDIRHYASGGLVDYTGPAWVDGTPQHPEAFIDADTTKLLRENLFSRSDSLLSFARDLVQTMHGTSYNLDTNNITEQSGLNIEKIDVNVKVDKVANDYDARTMGNMVMDEILTIARKSGTRGLSRR